jgi:hypothetical protein
MSDLCQMLPTAVTYAGVPYDRRIIAGAGMTGGGVFGSADPTHCQETKANGGSTLARCVVHFN